MILALVVAGLLALACIDAVVRPVFRRLAIRNALRRRNEALLIVLGSVIGTAIVTSSFVVGDTLHATIRDEVRTRLGPIDEIALVHQPDQLPVALDRVTGRPFPGVDGVLTETTANAAVSAPAASGGPPRAEPGAYVHELDFDAARQFGGRPADTGLEHAGPTPTGDEAVVGEDLARELRVRSGDTIDVHAYGQTRTLRVRNLVPRVGVAGFHPGFATTAANVFVAPGTLAQMSANAPPGSQLPEGRVLVSNDGGVFDSTSHSTAIVQELQTRTAGIGSVEVTDEKRQTLAFAQRQGDNFSRLFGLIGSFTVVAGVLLLVNVFVMLAEERKRELGTMRAVGLKRNHLVRVFGLEGNLYSIAAAILGTGLGIVVGRIVVQVTQSIFEQGERAVSGLQFTVRPGSLLTAFAIGLGISLATVWLASIRISRLNIIRAIRELPERRRAGLGARGELLVRAGIAAGVALLVAGIVVPVPVAALVGPALALWCAVPVLGRRISHRAAVDLVAVTVIGYALVALPLLPSVFRGAEIQVFFVQGLVLVLSAVVLVVNNDDRIRRLVERVPGGSRLAGRLGLANPLAQRVRTGLLLAMYALIVFVLVFMAIFAAIFRDQAPRVARETAAGYDLRVDSNVGNPVSAAQLQQQPGVAVAVPLVVSGAQFQKTGSELAYQQRLTGFDDTLLARGVPALSSRDPRYPTDEAAWRGVLADPEQVIVPSTFLSSRVGPIAPSVAVGDHLTLIDPGTGRRHPLTIAGIAGDLDPVENGAMVAARNLPVFVDRAAGSRYYVAVQPGADPKAVAAQLQASLLDHGVQAETFEALVDDHLRGQSAFIALLQGFLALGLLIGIAGLGVVMIRAVRERRHEIGVLRALGLPAGTVRRAFLVEATFVAGQGVIVGVVLGVATGYSVLTQSAVFGDQRLPFTVPWPVVAGLAIVALGASLLAVLAPAAQAAAIKPAVALRTAE